MYLSLCQSCLDEKIGSLPNELLILPKLLVGTDGTIDLSTDFLPAPIYKDTRSTCCHIGTFQRGSDSSINDDLVGGIDRLVVKPPFYMVLIPEEL